MTCHHLEPGAKGPDGLPPIGPAWKEVATKYKGQKGAISESDARKLVSWILKLQ
jgi:cytochrome c